MGKRGKEVGGKSQGEIPPPPFPFLPRSKVSTAAADDDERRGAQSIAHPPTRPPNTLPAEEEEAKEGGFPLAEIRQSSGERERERRRAAAERERKKDPTGKRKGGRKRGKQPRF